MSMLAEVIPVSLERWMERFFFSQLTLPVVVCRELILDEESIGVGFLFVLLPLLPVLQGNTQVCSATCFLVPQENTV
jgi:hypothetical protein